jgi:superoxide dismutase, Fe-Mn family
MSVKLMKLPYALDALEPYISQETLEFHYGKHYKKYVTTLNELISGTPYDKMELEEIIRDSSDGAVENEDEIFNNAAQVWNHDFFWASMTPKSAKKPDEGLLSPIIESFGSLQNFKDEFTEAADKLFGSGWTWLIKKPDQSLKIESFSNANNPLTREGERAILVVDVWEHAYYLDYKNERPKFLKQFWKVVNWDFVAKNLSQSEMKEPFYRQQEQESVVQHH